MPCYQSTSLPFGVTTTGRNSYTTQADCNQACGEGACCEGPTCRVKPQCQCQCRTGSCCGPDTITLDGVTGPTCRLGTKAECDARGGVWRDCIGCAADANNPSVVISPCQATDGSNVIVPVFRGVGTTCSPNPCGCCGNGESIAGKTATLVVSANSMPVLRWCPQVIGGTPFLRCPDGLQYGGCWAVKPCETPTIGAWVDTSFSASATFTSNAPASSCLASLQGQCLAETRSASVRFSASPCKIYATVDCIGLMALRNQGGYISPYWAWNYDPQTTEYNALYYVFQYLTGDGTSTATQSVNLTPVPPPARYDGRSWNLFKTVTVTMRLTLA